MVNFKGHLDWAEGCPENWWNIVPGCDYDGVSRQDKHFKSRLRRWLLPLHAGTIQCTEGLNRGKMGKDRFSLCLSLDIPFSCPWMWIPCFHAFALGLNSFPGPPACRLQILGLCCIHNHVSKFLSLYSLLILLLWAWLAHIINPVFYFCCLHVTYL